MKIGYPKIAPSLMVFFMKLYQKQTLPHFLWSDRAMGDSGDESLCSQSDQLWAPLGLPEAQRHKKWIPLSTGRNFYPVRGSVRRITAVSSPGMGDLVPMGGSWNHPEHDPVCNYVHICIHIYVYVYIYTYTWIDVKYIQSYIYIHMLD